MITTFNTAVTETASEILCKHQKKKENPGSLQKFLICASKPEGSEKCKEVNNNKRCMKKA